MSLLLIFTLATALIASTSGASDWNYGTSRGGPNDWGLIGTDCGPESKRQSPIDFSPRNTIVDATIPEIKFHNYHKILDRLNVQNNGHTIKIIVPEGEKIQISGGNLPGTYTLTQFHFHWADNDAQGSEHTSNKLHYPLEVHLVHTKDGSEEPTSDPDGLAVVGVFFHLADAAPSSKNISEIAGRAYSQGYKGYTRNEVGLKDLLPADRSYFYRYLGSLTTPPCSEAVIWTVMQQSLPITQGQLGYFRTVKDTTGAVLGKNYRPVQALHDRTIKLRVPSDNVISAAPHGQPGLFLFTTTLLLLSALSTLRF